MANINDLFSAGAQSLGYQYQPRFGMLRMMELPEDTALLIERDDDLDFTDGEDAQTLASLKHKAPGDRLTDLSPDFWKSIRIWLKRYNADGRQASRLAFFLFTTGTVSEDSYLINFVPGESKIADLARKADEVIAATTSPALLRIKSEFDELSSEDKADFLLRITIFDHQVRIDEIPSKIMSLMRSVRTTFRPHVFQRLEGWWNNEIINLMTGKRVNPIFGSEISEVLAEFSDQFKKENLPIDFRNSEPPDGVDPVNDNRMFVRQLQALGLKPNRVRRSILDYYRAFEQRGSWLREQIVLNGELEDYEDRLVDEWDRFKNICFEHLDAESEEDIMVMAGKDLLKWAETNISERLRIRPLVTEAYVMMGSFHILANEILPKVHWHPAFIERLDGVLSDTEP